MERRESRAARINKMMAELPTEVIYQIIRLAHEHPELTDNQLEALVVHEKMHQLAREGKLEAASLMIH